jgi:type IV pilus assembly protein PilM
MLTVNIEDNSVKITSVKGKRVAFAVETPLQPGWVQNGVVLEKAHVGQVISMVLAQYKIREKEVSACVSGIHSVYRVVYVPRLNPALLAEAARKEMERAIPVPLDSLYTSWSDIKVSQHEIALCLVGLPFDNVNSVSEVLKLAGLQVKYLELKPLAIARVTDEKTAIVLNVQANSFDVAIIADGIPELIRCLPFPGPDMNDGGKAATIKEETDRTVNFYNSSHPNSLLNSLTPCILSGYYRETLSMILGYAVKPAPVLLLYPGAQDDNVFTANTGLALRTLNRLTRVDVNVIPRTASSSGRAATTGASPLPLVALIICALALLGMFVTNSTGESETIRLQLQMNEKTKLLSDIQKASRDETARATAERESYQKILATVKGPLTAMAAQRELTNRDLRDAISLLPGTVYLKKITVSSGSITMDGAAPSEDILLNYARALRNLGIYNLVLISSVSNSTYMEITFTITVSLKR